MTLCINLYIAISITICMVPVMYAAGTLRDLTCITLCIALWVALCFALQYASIYAYRNLCMLPGPCGTQRNTLCMLPGPCGTQRDPGRGEQQQQSKSWAAHLDWQIALRRAARKRPERASELRVDSSTASRSPVGWRLTASAPRRAGRSARSRARRGARDASHRARTRIIDR